MPDLSARQEWKFDPHLSDAELRKARALEYIAHYLDRIEQHLETIAKNSDHSNIKTAVSNGFAGLSQMIARVAK